MRADDTSHVWGAGWFLSSRTGTNHTSLALHRLLVAATADLDLLTGATTGVMIADTRLAKVFERLIETANAMLAVGTVQPLVRWVATD